VSRKYYVNFRASRSVKLRVLLYVEWPLFEVIYLVLLFISLCVSFGLRIKILCRIVLWQVSAFVMYPLRIRSVFISDDFRFQIRFRGFRFHFRFRHDRGKQKR
jgi:hypothetical protein